MPKSKQSNPVCRAQLRFADLTNADIFAALFALSIVSFIASNLLAPSPLGLVLTIAGTAACGFSWLLARAMFRQRPAQERWPILIVLALILTGAALRLISPGGAVSATGLRMADNLHSLLSSTVLLLALVEIYHNYSAALPRAERRFRRVYTVGYVGLLLISVVWLRGAADGTWLNQSGDQIRVACAALALGFASGAWWYRRRHPLPKVKRQYKPRAPASEAEAALTKTIRLHFDKDSLHLEPELKLSDLARKLGEKDYKISQCITGPMGFRNFNHMVNYYRIETAKQALIDPKRKDTILQIALDAGFASIGPFNRAFKAETGLTPRSFRSQAPRHA